jgi:hypothetical protein
MCEGGRPAFMRIIADIDRAKSYNKYLLRPLVGGELVKIDSNQNPSSDGFSASAFRRQFVRIVRKDATGAWTDVFVTTWDALESLKKKL